MKTTIIIADDHQLFADGLEQIIQLIPDFDIVAKVTDGRMLMQKLINIQPDIILMDINMPYLNGIEAAEKIKTLYPKISIVFISMYHKPQIVQQAKDVGAIGFIMKDVTAPVLEEAMLSIKNGNPTFIAFQESKPYKETTQLEDNFNDKLNLTPREKSIIQLIKNGYTSKGVAITLGLSIYTVETHRKNINRKLHVQSASELLALAHKIEI